MNIISQIDSAKSSFIKIAKSLAALFGWTRASYYLMSVFVATILLIIIVWWPLAEEYLASYNPEYSFWIQADWLLLGIFLAMSFLIMAGADLKVDFWIVFVGLAGGLVIESWGTQTNLWFYYTNERPPLWIIPAWPIASLSIDRLVRMMNLRIPMTDKPFRLLYWITFSGFLALLLPFIIPTIDKSLTWMALLICILLILSPKDHRLAVITFFAGSGLGYFLELWGTTRLCWTYYTYQTPPVFAVFAHGMAAVAFWRASLLLKLAYSKFIVRENPIAFDLSSEGILERVE
jgi:hypothetical protein